ncbi:MAG: hypothetical protein IPN53_09660 [Comamonadaceae bacterium]|nr:hypothetical protein [Comamonadaceae bacterium]
MAAVHCVIIGFGLQDRADKVIFEYEDIAGEPHAVTASHISPYLTDAPDVLITNGATHQFARCRRLVLAASRLTTAFPVLDEERDDFFAANRWPAAGHPGIYRRRRVPEWRETLLPVAKEHQSA